MCVRVIACVGGCVEWRNSALLIAGRLPLAAGPWATRGGWAVQAERQAAREKIAGAGPTALARRRALAAGAARAAVGRGRPLAAGRGRGAGARLGAGRAAGY